MTGKAVRGPWKDAVERRQRLDAERSQLQDALDDALGRPRTIRAAAQPQRWFGFSAFEWNVLRILVLWSLSFITIGIAIGQAL